MAGGGREGCRPLRPFGVRDMTRVTTRNPEGGEGHPVFVRLCGDAKLAKDQHDDGLRSIQSGGAAAGVHRDVHVAAHETNLHRDPRTVNDTALRCQTSPLRFYSEIATLADCSCLGEDGARWRRRCLEMKLRRGTGGPRDSAPSPPPA